MREVDVKAGERTKVLGLMTRNLRARVEFEVEAADGLPPRGVIEASHGSALVGRKTATLPLSALNTFDKPWNQHGYQIHITSETDAVVRFRTKHIRDVHIYGAMAVMSVVGVIAMLIGLAVKHG